MLKNTLLITSMSLVLFSCAKEKEYDEVFISKEELQKNVTSLKSFCDSSDPFIYVPSVANSPYAVTASRPYWQGEQKLVGCDLKESEIKFFELEKDSRYSQNDNNKSPVLSIPIEYVDYKCKEDEFGKCTNSEVIDEEKEWYEKKYVNIKMDDFKVIESNSLPIQMSELFQAGCFTKLDTEITKTKLENKALNITAKVTYKAAAKCVDTLQSYDDLRYLNFSIDYKYSLVKLSELADKNYSKVLYPKTDQKTFGFFTTEIKKKSIDNNDGLQGLTTTYMNRWSPNKKKVVYNLNKEFFLEENKGVLSATLKAISAVNKSLAKAKAGYVIDLEDGSNKEIGDLRNNFIILVGDPQASGVIGYGPSVANPLTGEIVNARTVMYLGTIKRFVSRTWDEIAKVNNEQIESSQVQVNTQTQSSSTSDNLLSRMLTDYVSAEDMVSVLREVIHNDARDLNFFEKEALKKSMYNANDDSLFNNQEKLFSVISKQAKIIEEMSKDTFFHASNMNFAGTISSAMSSGAVRQVTKQAQAAQRYPLWDELTEEQRANLMEQLLPMVFIPTMVHEFGHNLGLRHNFAGSRDKDNYYSKEELKELGVEQQATYSSIMDYAHNTLEELSVLGKYDIAALKYAYAGLIDVEMGEQTIEVPLNGATIADAKKQLSEAGAKLKPYLFCTDENVSNDPLCNRFDSGTNSEEVVKHYIDTYKEQYARSNFRGRKFDMNSISGDMSYLIRVFNSFYTIRRFFDVYDQMVFINHGREEDTAQFKTAKASAEASFDFFMETLETPSYSCVERNVKTKEITRVASFEDFLADSKLSEYGIEFDIRYGCILLASYQKEKGKFEYFEFGKYFNNTLDLVTVDRSKTSDMISQIDVRGNWIDKAIAARFLSIRIGSPSTIGKSSNGNYFDYPEFRERILDFSDSLLKNKQDVKTIATNFTHDKEKTDAKINIEASLEMNKSHVINKSYNGFINYFFGLSETRNSFKLNFIEMLKDNLRPDGGQVARDEKLIQKFSVRLVNAKADETYLMSVLGLNSFVSFKNEAGEITHKFGLNEDNSIAAQLKELKCKAESEILSVSSGLEVKSLTPRMISDLDYALKHEKLKPAQVSRDIVTQKLIQKLHDMDARVAKRLVREAKSASEELESILSSFIALAK